MGIESPVHLLFIAAVALIVLGPKRLPQLARGLGQAIREFRTAIESAQEERAQDLDAASEGSTADGAAAVRDGEAPIG